MMVKIIVLVLVYLITPIVVTSSANNVDPLVSEQWYLQNIHAIQAKEKLPQNHNKAIIAILDVGEDFEHPDLENITWNGNGLHGFNLVSGEIVPDCVSELVYTHDCFYLHQSPMKIVSPYDYNWHGTHVSGIAAAERNNYGIEGVSDAIIMPIKVLYSADSIWNVDATVAMGIIVATDAGANVISMSIGTPNDSVYLRDAVDYAYAHNVVLVAAAGNSNSADLVYPAAYDKVISVAASNKFDKPWIWSDDIGSNYGDTVDIIAPGEYILSDASQWYTNFGYYYRGFGWINGTGTSMATPMVSGTAALVIESNPNLNVTQIVSIIENSTDDIGLPHDKFGHGLLNESKAVDMALSTR